MLPTFHGRKCPAQQLSTTHRLSTSKYRCLILTAEKAHHAKCARAAKNANVGSANETWKAWRSTWQRKIFPGTTTARQIPSQHLYLYVFAHIQSSVGQEQNSRYFSHVTVLMKWWYRWIMSCTSTFEFLEIWLWKLTGNSLQIQPNLIKTKSTFNIFRYILY